MTNRHHDLFDRLVAANWNLPLIPISAEEREAAKVALPVRDEPPVFGDVKWDSKP